jgi:hypothetical protein
MNELIVRNSKIRAIFLMLGGISFVVLGRFVMAEGNVLGGVIITLFFGLSIPLGFFMLLDSKPKLVMDASGVNVSAWKVGLIPWSEVEDVKVQKIEKTTFICFYLRNENMFVQKLSPYQKSLLFINHRLGLPAFAILPSALATSESVIMDAVKNHLKGRSYQRNLQILNEAI